jgi:FAD/FMN-containing dehydrogenase
MRAAPEQLNTSYLGFPSFGEGIPPVSQIVYVWADDDLDAAAAAIAPLLAIPGVTGHTIDRMPYADVLMDAQPDAEQVDAPAMKMIDDNGFAAAFDDELITGLAEVKSELGDTILMVRMLGGAYGRVPTDATAWGYRDTEAWLISVAFVPEAMYDEAAPRTRATWSRLSPWLKGMYGSFSTHDDAVSTMYPPSTLARLRSVKAAYDPANLFHRAHNITPA